MKTKILISSLVVAILTSLFVNLFFKESFQKRKKDNQTMFTDISKAVIDGTKVLQVDLTGAIFYAGPSARNLKQIIRQIDDAAKDDETKGLFIRANSPGGSIVASQELYEAVRRFQETGKPIITSMMEVCASGCYYAVLPSTTIIANRGSIVGSIGVIMTTINLEELYKKIGVKRSSITSVKYKDLLSPNRKMRPEEREHLQKIIYQLHEDFISDVVNWRKKNNSERSLRQTANGLIYTSDMALSRGLIDKVGDQRFAQEEMAQLLDVSREDIRFIKPAFQYWDEFLGFQARGIGDTLLSSFRSIFFPIFSLGADIENTHQFQY